MQHTRRSIRLENYDYRSAGTYFVTICASGGRQIFGAIRSNGLALSSLGQVLREQWLALPERRPGLVLDEFVIMPNHFHALLGLPNPQSLDLAAGGQRLLAESLGAVIGGFKSGVTREWRRRVGQANAEVWHRNFYEHIVRHDYALERIRQYIFNNPATWLLDRENPDRQGLSEFYAWLESYRRAVLQD